jgi:hypothetical protein
MDNEKSTGPQTGRYYGGILGMSVAQLFCGIGNLALGIANAVICGFLGPIGYGIWGSVLCFIAGSTGIAAGINRRRATVIAHMVLSVITAVAACVQLAMGTSSAVADYQTTKKEHGSWSIYFDSLGLDHYRTSSAFNYFDMWGCSTRQRNSYATRFNGPTVTDSLLAVFAIFQGILAIMSAIFSCRATVCPPGVDHMPWESDEVHLVKA